MKSRRLNQILFVPPPDKRLIVIPVIGMLLLTLLFVGGSPVDAEPGKCHLDPSGILICEGTAVATPQPPGTARATLPPRPTRTPTPWGLYTLWKYCVADASSPSGFINLRYSCNQITKQCTLVQAVNAANCSTPTPTTSTTSIPRGSPPGTAGSTTGRPHPGPHSG